MINPNVACDIITACIVLNNNCRDRNTYVDILPLTDDTDTHLTSAQSLQSKPSKSERMELLQGQKIRN